MKKIEGKLNTEMYKWQNEPRRLKVLKIIYKMKINSIQIWNIFTKGDKHANSPTMNSKWMVASWWLAKSAIINVCLLPDYVVEELCLVMVYVCTFVCSFLSSYNHGYLTYFDKTWNIERRKYRGNSRLYYIELPPCANL